MHAPRLESSEQYKELWDRAQRMVAVAKEMSFQLTIDQITPNGKGFLLIDGEKPIRWLQDRCAEETPKED